MPYSGTPEERNAKRRMHRQQHLALYRERDNDYYQKHKEAKYAKQKRYMRKLIGFWHRWKHLEQNKEKSK